MNYLQRDITNNEMEDLNCVNHQEKLIFFRNEISVVKVELQLKIKIIKSQAAKMICFI